ncbi:hypothetical protein [Legionella jordanis]|uniref:Uncharacterized protein n=1 Tax=Legionella jordanis TaxID=456 RepID=A0A0W0VCD8_9GAMM|nr:hypothetical protein [Legionella jordanis]KTD17796.1 hypothetical protein Ljor_2102 [Legionella jordanis]RMX02501.1 hypothetical protein EAW55_09655 [Legionella jordanis]RMX21656.1 hypothetical protein EAS68_02565 [Legionella jordanis]VEH11267.1 Uncharacterised protein [Legionella jordanis]HAT8713765.1 hypothetical protein [Legionella jordanis]
MKKIALFVLASLFISLGYASKLSKFFDKMDAEDKARQQREWQQDMNFQDFAFRLDKRYVDDRGERCRDYVFRSRSNPYRHGYFTVCDER